MATPKLIDAHTHVQFAAFDNDREEVIRRSIDAGIWMVNVGSQKDTSRAAIDLAHKYSEGVYATVGLHPIHTEESFHDAEEAGDEKGFKSRGEDFDYEYYKKLASDPKVVAVGECGLDYYRIKNQEVRIKQEKVFIQQIELAQELKKPLMIHCREAYEDLIKILQVNSYKLQPRGIVHFFSGSKEDAKEILDIGFYFTFGGVITFSKSYDEIVKFVPLDRILIETDAPYVAPVPYRGKRNEPTYVAEVAKKLAEIKLEDLEKVSEITVKNTREILKI